MTSTARGAFALYLRTGRRVPEGAFARRPIELKFNANHDPDNGRFISGPGVTGAGEPSDGSGIDQPETDRADSVRPGAALLRAAEIAEGAAAGRHSSGDCYKYVKRALLRAGAVPDYLPGIAAKDSGIALAKRGFVDLLGKAGGRIKSPYDAPIGSVLVYDPTPGAKGQSFGHIELRTSHGFASDYVSAIARTGSRDAGLVGNGRRLKGVWVKH